MTQFKLPRLNQCEKCPWKVGVNPYDIPDGYDIEKHKKLRETIAKDDSVCAVNKVMACHHSFEEDNMYCIGYLHNQLGVGNNVGLRIRMLNCSNIQHIKVIGEQHRSFEDTIPKTQ